MSIVNELEMKTRLEKDFLKKEEKFKCFLCKKTGFKIQEKIERAKYIEDTWQERLDISSAEEIIYRMECEIELIEDNIFYQRLQLQKSKIKLELKALELERHNQHFFPSTDALWEKMRASISENYPSLVPHLTNSKLLWFTKISAKIAINGSGFNRKMVYRQKNIDVLKSVFKDMTGNTVNIIFDSDD